MSVMRQEICRAIAAHQISQGYFSRNILNRVVASNFAVKDKYSIVFVELSQMVFDQSASNHQPLHCMMILRSLD